MKVTLGTCCPIHKWHEGWDSDGALMCKGPSDAGDPQNFQHVAVTALYLYTLKSLAIDLDNRGG